MDFESIRPGMSQQERSEAVRAILQTGIFEHAQPSEKTEDDGTGPPVPPDLTGKTEAEQAALMRDHATAREAYFDELMCRPAGKRMTKAESSAFAGEITAALKDSGFRF